MNELERWSIAKSRELYGFQEWGAGYFNINDSGHACITPRGPSGPSLDLYNLVQAMADRDIELPILFRFNDILRDRVRTMFNAFRAAIAENNYQGSYLPTYPIKVNQQHHVVDVLRSVGDEYRLGLEAGSKPELIAVLAMHESPEALLLCNGYKDEEYIELALMSRKVGRRAIIIIEKLSELDLILSIADRLGVEPEIGFRLRVSGRGVGRWEHSGGDRAKFGLTIGEILYCVKELEKRDRISALTLLHFHIGSQMTSIGSLRTGLKEAGQVYVQLYRRCPNLKFIDIGGGLGVDYDGSKTNFESSMNYTMEEYARDVVWILHDACEQAEVPHPDIVTESGRATVAYHSVLVFNVLGIANSFPDSCDPKQVMDESNQLTVQNLGHLLEELTPKNCQETLHDAVALRTEILQQFNLGLIGIEERALADQCFWAILNRIVRHSSQLHYVPEDLERLPAILTDTYFCNLSVFQSIPDSWAIEQIFPVTPIHRLDERPMNRVVLADITCDSDGKIDRFADLRDVKPYLPAHHLENGKPYYFAVYLVGAYQEILGDLHNLFGDTNAVHVEIDSNGRAEFSHIIFGDTVDDVLRYVQYDKNQLCRMWRNALEQAVQRGKLTPTESAQLYKKYAQAFDGYTYLLGQTSNGSS